MTRLIKAEIYKVYKTRVIKVLCVIMILLAVMLLGLSKLLSSEDFIKSSLKGMSEAQQEQFMNQLQSVSNADSTIVQPGGGMGFHIASKDIFNPKGEEIYYASYGAGTMEIIIAVLIGAVVAGEYSSGTIKNILAYGKRREHYYLSKLIAISIAVGVLLGIMVSVASIGASIMYGWGGNIGIIEVLKTFIAALIVGTSVSSLIMLIATLAKSNGTTIGIGIVLFTVVPTIISNFYGKYNWFDRLYELTPAYNWAVITSTHATSGDFTKAIIVSIITILIATLSGIMIFKKQDIR
ncbi:ABC transporter permease subunit [Clostridium sp. 'White wine YQ']|uniref:ABC transporter permease subunit n=1 Tax=Clostridium sp. 'White wine YQ' TaxID=3027474 RepID=UPI002366A3A7|nr:ABC transporter permease subunit [Clostridium sp. 'White wine YQ']MDD7793886.1 ABC transporter permease subunit [Clostridium sp. 'White wine YQ']